MRPRRPRLSAAWRRLAPVTDALFGDAGGAPAGGGWRFLGVTALFVAVILARRPDLLTTPQLLLEDGLLFFPQNAVLGFPRALFEPYQGFPYLAHRLIALLGGLVPPAEAARVYVGSAVLLTALGLAAFSLPAFRHLVRSDALRVVFGLAVLSLPLDNLPERTLGTVANLGWLLAIWLFLAAVMRLPRRPWRVAAVALLAAVAALSTPLALLCLPLWVLRLGRGVWRRQRGEVVFALLPLAALAGALLVTGDLGARPTFRVGDAELAIDPARIAAHAATLVAALVAPPEALAAWSARGPVVVPLLAGAVVALLAGLGGRERQGRMALLLALYGFAAALVLTMVGRAVLGYLDPLALPPRYRVFPGAMLCLATVAALDGVPAGRRRAIALAVTLAVWTWARAPGFVLPPPADVQWRRQAPELARAVRQPCPVRSSFRMQPVPLEVVWGSRHPQPPPPAPEIVAALGPGEQLSAPLDVTCGPLSEVSLNLSAERLSLRGRLRVEVYAAGAPVPLARALMPRAQARRGWTPFCLVPAAAAPGRYRVVLRADGTDPAVPVRVMGAAGRAALTYGCVERDTPHLPIVESLQRR